MDRLEFGKTISGEKLAEIFRNFFEQHMAVYELLKGIQFVSINVDINNKTSIMYSIKILNNEEKNILFNKLQVASGHLLIYEKSYNFNVFMNGDLLCITIK